MATIVNNPPNENGGNSVGLLIGIILLVVVVLAFIFYGLPYLRASTPSTPQVNVPGKIDVNVKSGN